VLGLIRSLHQDSIDVAELRDSEKLHVADVTQSLRSLIEPLGKSFQLEPSLFPKLNRNVTEVVLSPQGSICLIRADGSIVTRSLENLSSESLLKVLSLVLPEVRRELAEKRSKLAARSELLEKVSSELKRVPSFVPSHWRIRWGPPDS
jgi:hypothetical protein